MLRHSNSSLSAAQITHGFRIMPQVDSNALNIPFGGVIGRILYPFGVSFLLPVFVLILGTEIPVILTISTREGSQDTSHDAHEWPQKFILLHFTLCYLLHPLRCIYCCFPRFGQTIETLLLFSNATECALAPLCSMGPKSNCARLFSGNALQQVAIGASCNVFVSYSLFKFL